MRTVRRVLLASVGAVLLVGAGVAALAYHRLYRPAIAFHASVARTGVGIAHYQKEFLDDQAYVAGLPFFAPRKGAHDAGPVIGSRIHWVLVKPGTIDYRALSDDAIDRGLYDKLGDDWLNAPPERWSGLDFGWMAELSQLDFWDLEQNSVSDPADLLGPDPLVSDLLAWAELRLAKGQHEEALASAVAEVQDLARLCFTTERLSTFMDGIALLATVNGARRKAGGLPRVADLQRIQRAVYGAVAFARLETPPQYAASFERLMVGRCAALHGGTWAALLLRPELLESRSAEYRRLEQLLSLAPECRLWRIRERWARPDDLTGRLEGDDWWDRTLWRWSPAWRRVKGETMVAIGAQDWFKGYDKAPTAQSP